MSVFNARFLQANKKRIAFFIKLIVSALLIWLLLRAVDGRELLEVLRTASPLALVGALALGLIQVGLVAIRWIAVIRALGGRLGAWPGLCITFIGGFFNQALPSAMGGDVFRVYLGGKEPGLGLQRAFSSVLLERVLNVIGLVVLAAIALPVMLSRPGGEELAVLVPIVALLAAGCVFGTGVLMLLDRLPEALTRFRVIRAFVGLSVDARRLFLRPSNVVLPMAAMMASLIEFCLVLYVLAIGLDIDISFLEGLAFFSLALLATSLPISVGGWGVREGVMVALLGMIGVPGAQAFALSVLYGLIAILGTLPGGLIWIAYGYNRSDMEKAEKTVAAETP